MLEHHVWLPQKQFLLEQVPDFLYVDLVELVVVERRLEAAQAFEDLQDLALGVAQVDVGVLARPCRLLGLH